MLGALNQRSRRLWGNGLGLSQHRARSLCVAALLGLKRLLAAVMRYAGGERCGTGFFQHRCHVDRGSPVARALGQRQQRQSRLGFERRAVKRPECRLGAVEQPGLHEVLGQRMLRPLAVASAQICALQQVLMHPHRALKLASAAEQIAQREMQLAGVGVVLHGLDESVYGLVGLLIEQQVQTFEIGFGRLPVGAPPLAQVDARCQPAQQKCCRQCYQQADQQHARCCIAPGVPVAP